VQIFERERDYYHEVRCYRSLWFENSGELQVSLISSIDGNKQLMGGVGLIESWKRNNQTHQLFLVALDFCIQQSIKMLKIQSTIRFHS